MHTLQSVCVIKWRWDKTISDVDRYTSCLSDALKSKRMWCIQGTQHILSLKNIHCKQQIHIEIIIKRNLQSRQKKESKHLRIGAQLKNHNIFSSKTSPRQTNFSNQSYKLSIGEYIHWVAANNDQLRSILYSLLAVMMVKVLLFRRRASLKP